MEARKGGAGFFDEWNRLQIEIEDVVNPIYLVGSVHPDKAVRDAADPCLTKYTNLSTELFQSEKLFARTRATKPANAHQAKLRKDLVEAFEDSGVALPPEKRKRAKEIFERLEELRQAYDKSVRDDPTTVVIAPAEMEGLPGDYVKAQKKDEKGNYVLRLDVLGEGLFDVYCVICHGEKGSGSSFTNLTLMDGASGKDDANLTKIILEALPEASMPDFGKTLTDEQIADLVAFIRTWK